MSMVSIWNKRILDAFLACLFIRSLCNIFVYGHAYANKTSEYIWKFANRHSQKGDDKTKEYQPYGQTSCISNACFSTLRAFIIRTIAAWMYSFRSSSTAAWVCSTSCWNHGKSAAQSHDAWKQYFTNSGLHCCLDTRFHDFITFHRSRVAISSFSFITDKLIDWINRSTAS